MNKKKIMFWGDHSSEEWTKYRKSISSKQKMIKGHKSKIKRMSAVVKLPESSEGLFIVSIVAIIITGFIMHLTFTQIILGGIIFVLFFLLLMAIMAISKRYLGFA